MNVIKQLLMKRGVVILAVCLFSMNVAGKSQSLINKIDTTAESEKYWSAWLKDLYDIGVVMDKDSIRINAEAKRIIQDSNFR